MGGGGSKERFRSGHCSQATHATGNRNGLAPPTGACICASMRPTRAAPRKRPESTVPSNGRPLPACARVGPTRHTRHVTTDGPLPCPPAPGSTSKKMGPAVGSTCMHACRAAPSRSQLVGPAQTVPSTKHQVGGGLGRMLQGGTKYLSRHARAHAPAPVLATTRSALRSPLRPSMWERAKVLVSEGVGMVWKGIEP